MPSVVSGLQRSISPNKARKRLIFTVFTLWLNLFLVAACGEEFATRSSYIPPTPPPTPANFDNVSPAATIAIGVRTTTTASLNYYTPLPTPTLQSDDDANRGFINADPTLMAQIFGTPGPGNSIPSGGSGKPSGVRPTPTLNTSSGQTTIGSLRTSRVSFQFAYRQALARVQLLQRQAVIVFASAQNLKPERTTWTFYFSWLEGRKTWRALFDARSEQAQPDLQLEEVASTMLSDVGQFDMARVLDGDELVSRVEAAGLRVNIPVDVVNFQLDGLTRQPSFIMTNAPQGKQLVINAYNGQILRNDF
ncbi:hypothetical protein [Candidatus Chlorohelix sp.]|uniref:hypothetical protein n=1 Tax=Candidatus Chlorohelix sp. TaxID=3139201 RepID=UPI003073F5C9